MLEWVNRMQHQLRACYPRAPPPAPIEPSATPTACTAEDGFFIISDDDDDDGDGGGGGGDDLQQEETRSGPASEDYVVHPEAPAPLPTHSQLLGFVTSLRQKARTALTAVKQTPWKSVSLDTACLLMHTVLTMLLCGLFIPPVRMSSLCTLMVPGKRKCKQPGCTREGCRGNNLVIEKASSTQVSGHNLELVQAIPKACRLLMEITHHKTQRFSSNKPPLRVVLPPDLAEDIMAYYKFGRPVLVNRSPDLSDADSPFLLISSSGVPFAKKVSQFADVWKDIQHDHMAPWAPFMAQKLRHLHATAAFGKVVKEVAEQSPQLIGDARMMGNSVRTWSKFYVRGQGNMLAQASVQRLTAWRQAEEAKVMRSPAVDKQRLAASPAASLATAAASAGNTAAAKAASTPVPFRDAHDVTAWRRGPEACAEAALAGEEAGPSSGYMEVPFHNHKHNSIGPLWSTLPLTRPAPTSLQMEMKRCRVGVRFPHNIASGCVAGVQTGATALSQGKEPISLDCYSSVPPTSSDGGESSSDNSDTSSSEDVALVSPRDIDLPAHIKPSSLLLPKESLDSPCRSPESAPKLNKTLQRFDGLGLEGEVCGRLSAAGLLEDSQPLRRQSAQAANKRQMARTGCVGILKVAEGMGRGTAGAEGAEGAPEATDGAASQDQKTLLPSPAAQEQPPVRRRKLKWIVKKGSQPSTNGLEVQAQSLDRQGLSSVGVGFGVRMESKGAATGAKSAGAAALFSRAAALISEDVPLPSARPQELPCNGRHHGSGLVQDERWPLTSSRALKAAKRWRRHQQGLVENGGAGGTSNPTEETAAAAVFNVATDVLAAALATSSPRLLLLPGSSLHKSKSRIAEESQDVSCRMPGFIEQIPKSGHIGIVKGVKGEVVVGGDIAVSAHKKRKKRQARELWPEHTWHRKPVKK